jgi:predicted MFS family arabinose efflux permease
MLFVSNYFKSYQGLPMPAWKRVILGFINTSAIGIFFYLSLYFSTVLHFSFDTTGLLISAYGVGTAIGGITSGKLCDRYSIHGISLVSLLLAALNFVFLSILKDPLFLGLNVFFLGFSNYGFKTSNQLWVMKHCNNNPNARLTALNILYAASNLGIGISGLIVALLEHVGFVMIFKLCAVLCAFNFIFLALQPRANFPPIVEELQTEEERKRNNLLATLVLVGLFFMGLIISFRTTVYLIYAHQTMPDASLAKISWLFTLNPVMVVLFQVPLIHRLQNMNKLLMLGAGAFLMGLGALGVALDSHYSTALLMAAIYTMGEMLFMTPAQLLVYEAGCETKKGQAMGLYQSVYATSVIVGPSLAGFLYEKVGPKSPWELSGILGTVVVTGCFFYSLYQSRSIV